MLLHTSGTTRRPKQVPLLQRNLMASVRVIGAHYLLTEGDVSYCAMPLFHVHGLIASVLAQLAAGGAVVTPRRLTPRRYWQQWPTALPGSLPPSIRNWSSTAQRRPSRPVSCVPEFSPAVPRPTQRLEDIYEAPVLEAYGMTEASHQMTSNRCRRRAGWVGRRPGRRRDTHHG